MAESFTLVKYKHMLIKCNNLFFKIWILTVTFEQQSGQVVKSLPAFFTNEMGRAFFTNEMKWNSLLMYEANMVAVVFVEFDW